LSPTLPLAVFGGDAGDAGDISENARHFHLLQEFRLSPTGGDRVGTLGTKPRSLAVRCGRFDNERQSDPRRGLPVPAGTLRPPSSAESRGFEPHTRRTQNPRRRRAGSVAGSRRGHSASGLGRGSAADVVRGRREVQTGLRRQVPTPGGGRPRPLEPQIAVAGGDQGRRVVVVTRQGLAQVCHRLRLTARSSTVRACSSKRRRLDLTFRRAAPRSW